MHLCDMIRKMGFMIGMLLLFGYMVLKHGVCLLNTVKLYLLPGYPPFSFSSGCNSLCVCMRVWWRGWGSGEVHALPRGV
jgi:hypothetical protein